MTEISQDISETAKQNDSETVSFFLLSNIPATVEAWFSFLEKYSNDIDFTGNSAYAASLLFNFVEGMKWCQSKFRLAGARETKLPKFALTDHKKHDYYGGIASVFLQKNKPPIVAIETGPLSRLSSDNPDRSVEVRSNEGIVFEGRLSEYYLLSGIEEFHHAAVYDPYHLSRVKKLVWNNKQPLASYRADDLEYLALQMQLACAREHHFAPYSIKSLEQRLNLANEARLLHGKK